MDRYIGNTLDAGTAGRQIECACLDRIVQTSDELRLAAQHVVTHLLGSLVVEAGLFEQVAQHAQHLPGRASFAQRLRGRIEALDAAFGIDEGSGSFGEGRHRQQAVGIFEGRSRFEWRQHDHAGRLLQCSERCGAIGTVEFGFGPEHQISLARFGDETRRIAAALLRTSLGDMAADAVGCFADEAELRAEQICQLLRQALQRRGLRMLLGKVAEQDAGALSCNEAGSNLLCRLAGADFLELGTECRILGMSYRLDHFGQQRGQLRRSGDRLGEQLDVEIVGGRMQHRDLRTLLGALAQALRDQRMILAQEAAHHQHAVERTDVGDLHAQPGCPVALAVEAEIALTQAEIDVVGAEAAQQLAGQCHFLERRMRADERTERVGALVLRDIAQRMGRIVEGDVPVDLLPRPALLHHRLHEAPIVTLAVQAFVGETLLVGEPAFVDGFVFERQDALDLVVQHLHDQVAAESVMRTHRLAA